ncbi:MULTISPECIES: MTH1187 family thiamine-binding protein [Aedoeadaptatus]|uniref:MTH1187 family thiamine-binding protein n=1 Tax=Aedoeadaptatus acetigenes TaxID=2981723 RepID=A0ABV1J715_9FIRM|nr:MULTISPECIES: MTH1187 family thiamine-binding protein [Peptoniphilaceae]MBS6525628.1 MTH1187 family thiamine-binding protein [Peptoniphilaceae bacterium]MCU6786286.1 MTH1187 family thiamine-binding protein [Aedoeadaptatus acetigenes]
MAVVELTLVPIGTQKTSCSPFVAAAYDAVKDNDKVEIRLNPMGTVLEGDIDELFACVRKMQEAVFEAGADRVYSVVKIDDRRDKKASLDQKVNSVMSKLV